MSSSKKPRFHNEIIPNSFSKSRIKYYIPNESTLLNKNLSSFADFSGIHNSMNNINPLDNPQIKNICITYGNINPKRTSVTQEEKLNSHENKKEEDIEISEWVNSKILNLINEDFQGISSELIPMLNLVRSPLELKKVLDELDSYIKRYNKIERLIDKVKANENEVNNLNIQLENENSKIKKANGIIVINYLVKIS